MSKKKRADSEARKIELVNKKVSEINRRREGLKTTRIEDDLDKQELNNYMRVLGVEPESIKLESAEFDTVARDRVFYATLFVEGLIEISLIYFIISLLLKPAPTNTEYAAIVMMAGAFVYLAYTMYTTVKKQKQQ